MFSNVKEDFAFKVLDPAVIPKKKIKPVRSRIVILLTILGFFFSLFVSLILWASSIIKTEFEKNSLILFS